MFKLRHLIAIVILLSLLIPTTPAYAASATITVSGTPWGQSTCYIGATEGNVRFDISDLQAAGMNTYSSRRSFTNVSLNEFQETITLVFS